jgi:hypothetical protein
MVRIVVSDLVRIKYRACGPITRRRQFPFQFVTQVLTASRVDKESLNEHKTEAENSVLKDGVEEINY